MCETTHCVQKYTVKSIFRVNCEQKIPLSQFFYTSAAIDASDKYQVWVNLLERSCEIQIYDIWHDSWVVTAGDCLKACRSKDWLCQCIGAVALVTITSKLRWQLCQSNFLVLSHQLAPRHSFKLSDLFSVPAMTGSILHLNPGNWDQNRDRSECETFILETHFWSWDQPYTALINCQFA